MSYDNLCKYLAENYPDRFAEWLLGYPVKSDEAQPLKTELSSEPIRADFLTLIGMSERILHIEFQTEIASDPPLPLRMLDYWVRLYRQHRVPVTQAIILLRPTTAELPDTFQLEQTSHRYNVIRMWEQDAVPLLQNPGLLPLAVLAQTDAPEQLLQQVAEQVRQVDFEHLRREISNCAQILAGLRFDKTLIRQIFREGSMKESVIYQEIIDEGRQEGRQEGMEQGRQEGRQEGTLQSLREAITDVLLIRFEETLAPITEALATIRDPQVLKELHRAAVLCESLESFLGQVEAVRTPRNGA